MRKHASTRWERGFGLLVRWRGWRGDRQAVWFCVAICFCVWFCYLLFFTCHWVAICFFPLVHHALVSRTDLVGKGRDETSRNKKKHQRKGVGICGSYRLLGDLALGGWVGLGGLFGATTNPPPSVVYICIEICAVGDTSPLAVGKEWPRERGASY